MLNFFYFKEFNQQYLLTNEFGQYAFVEESQLDDLIHDKIVADSPLGQELHQKGFLFSGSPHAFTEIRKSEYRNAKNYLFSSTSLFIFVVTTACNLGCVYCQANDGPATVRHVMNKEVAESAVTVALQSPNQYLTFEFQGGEPLLNFDVIQHIVRYTEANCGQKSVSFSVVTNLTLITDEMIDFFKEHNVSISTSLDGGALVHNQNRPYRDGSPSFNDVVKAVHKIRSAGLNVGAIQTTTRASLPYAKEIIDIYIQLGFQNIFLRPLTPLGCAKQHWNDIGYSPEEFLQFYSTALMYIIEKCQAGVPIQEGHATIFLQKILHHYPENYMELRSPCGASVGQMAFYCDGNVFTCDEGRMLYDMGKNDFYLGNVFQDTYHDLISNSVCCTACTASVTESIPACCDCVYQPYCGICPVVNYALYDDVIAKQPNHYRCKLYRGILDQLFGVIQEHQDACTVLERWHI